MEEGFGAMLRRAAAGDVRAFETLVEATHYDLRCFVAAHAWNVDLIDEVVQTTYITCFRSLNKYRGGEGLLPWLKGIARNHLRQEREARQKRARHQSERLVDLAAPLEDFDVDEVPADRLNECLARLRPQARTLIDLFYRSGCSLEDIAKQVQRTRASIAMALSRTRSALRVCLEERKVSDD